jgi:hypothetical protein
MCEAACKVITFFISFGIRKRNELVITSSKLTDNFMVLITPGLVARGLSV